MFIYLKIKNEYLNNHKSENDKSKQQQQQTSNKQVDGAILNKSLTTSSKFIHYLLIFYSKFNLFFLFRIRSK